MADFVTQHHKPSIDYVEPVPWTLFFDGSSCKQGGGIGIVIISPRGASFECAFPTEPMTTNNQAEYEAVLKCGGYDPGYPWQTTWVAPPGVAQPTR